MGRNMVIGIATTVVPYDRNGRNRSPFFSRLAARAHERDADLILFHPNEAQFDRHSLRGYMSSRSAGQTTWLKRTLPFPDVIYENVYVHLVMKGMARPLRAYAASRHIPLFNPLVPGKLSMNRIVQNHPECGLRVPVTREVSREQIVHDMLARFGTIYVKPTGGYGGRGVLRMKPGAGGRVTVDCDRFGDHGKLRQECGGRDFSDFIKRVVLRRPHIVQEQIPLLSLEKDSKIDFRVVVQRGLTGEWKLVGIVPKVTAAHGVVTNLVAGGKRDTLERIENAMHESGRKLPVQELERSALALASHLTKSHPTLGLIGYDLGVDEQSRVWFIELNPKPARTLLTAEMNRKAGDLLVDFASFLARNQ